VETRKHLQKIPKKACLRAGFFVLFLDLPSLLKSWIWVKPTRTFTA